MSDKYEIMEEKLWRARELVDSTYNVGSMQIDIPQNIGDLATEMFVTQMVGHAKNDDLYNSLNVSFDGVEGENGIVGLYLEMLDGMGANIYGTDPSTDGVMSDIRQIFDANHAGDQLDAYLHTGDKEALNFLKQIAKNKADGVVSRKAQKLMDEIRDDDGMIDAMDKVKLSAAFSSLKSAQSLYSIRPDALRDAYEPTNSLQGITGDLMRQGGAYRAAPWTDRLQNNTKYMN